MRFAAPVVAVNRNLLEIAIMATALTLSHPQFVFVFAAPRICMLRTIADDEHTARRTLEPEHPLSLAAHVPVTEVRI